MHHPGGFPTTRLRRTRRHAWLRAAVAETALAPSDLVWPLFVHAAAKPAAVPSMPGVARLSVGGAVRAAEEAASAT